MHKRRLEIYAAGGINDGPTIAHVVGVEEARRRRIQHVARATERAAVEIEGAGVSESSVIVPGGACNGEHPAIEVHRGADSAGGIASVGESCRGKHTAVDVDDRGAVQSVGDDQSRSHNRRSVDIQRSCFPTEGADGGSSGC